MLRLPSDDDEEEKEDEEEILEAPELEILEVPELDIPEVPEAQQVAPSTRPGGGPNTRHSLSSPSSSPRPSIPRPRSTSTKATPSSGKPLAPIRPVAAAAAAAARKEAGQPERSSGGRVVEPQGGAAWEEAEVAFVDAWVNRCGLGPGVRLHDLHFAALTLTLTLI